MAGLNLDVQRRKRQWGAACADFCYVKQKGTRGRARGQGRMAATCRMGYGFAVSSHDVMNQRI